MQENPYGLAPEEVEFIVTSLQNKVSSLERQYLSLLSSTEEKRFSPPINSRYAASVGSVEWGKQKLLEAATEYNYDAIFPVIHQVFNDIVSACSFSDIQQLDFEKIKDSLEEIRQKNEKKTQKIQRLKEKLKSKNELIAQEREAAQKTISKIKQGLSNSRANSAERPSDLHKKLKILSKNLRKFTTTGAQLLSEMPHQPYMQQAIREFEKNRKTLEESICSLQLSPEKQPQSHYLKENKRLTELLSKRDQELQNFKNYSKTTFDKYIEQNNTLYEQLEALRTKYSKAKTKNKELKDKYSTHFEEIENIKKQYAAYFPSVFEDLKKLNEEKTALLTENQSLKTQLQEKESGLSSLEVSSRRNQKQPLGRGFQGQQSINRKEERLTQLVKQYEAEIQLLSEKLETKPISELEFQTQIAIAPSKDSQLIEKLQELERINATLEKQLNEASAASSKITELEKTLEEKTQEILTLQTKTETQNTSIEQLKSYEEFYQEQINKLKTQLKQKQELIEETQTQKDKEILELQKTIKELQKQETELKLELAEDTKDQKIEELNKLIEYHSEEASSFKFKVEKLKEEKKNLKTENEKYHKEVVEILQGCDHMEQVIAKLQKENNSLKTQTSTKPPLSKQNSLGILVEPHNQKVTNLEYQIKNLKNELRKKEEVVLSIRENYESTLKDLKDQLHQRETISRSLNNSPPIAPRRRSQTQTKSDLENLELQLKQKEEILSSTKNYYIDKISQLNQKIQDKDTELYNLKNNYEKTIQKLKEELESSEEPKKELQNAKSRIKQLNKEKKDLENKTATLENKLKQLKQESLTESKTKKTEELTKDNQQLQKTKKQLENSLKQLQKNFEELKKSLNAKEKDIVDLNEQIKFMHLEREQEKAERDTYIRRIKELELENSLSQTKEPPSDSAAKIEQLQNELDSVQQKWQLKVKLLHNSIESKEQQIDSLRQENLSLKSKLKNVTELQDESAHIEGFAQLFKNFE